MQKSRLMAKRAKSRSTAMPVSVTSITIVKIEPGLSDAVNSTGAGDVSLQQNEEDYSMGSCDEDLITNVHKSEVIVEVCERRSDPADTVLHTNDTYKYKPVRKAKVIKEKRRGQKMKNSKDELHESMCAAGDCKDNNRLEVAENTLCDAAACDSDVNEKDNTGFKSISSSPGVKLTTQTQHKCEVCAKFYTSKASLQRHVMIHADVRPFQCETCGARFNRAHILESHKVRIWFFIFRTSVSHINCPDFYVQSLDYISKTSANS